MKAVTPGYGDNLAQKNLIGETVLITLPGLTNMFELIEAKFLKISRVRFDKVKAVFVVVII